MERKKRSEEIERTTGEEEGGELHECNWHTDSGGVVFVVWCERRTDGTSSGTN